MTSPCKMIREGNIVVKEAVGSLGANIDFVCVRVCHIDCHWESAFDRHHESVEMKFVVFNFFGYDFVQI